MLHNFTINIKHDLIATPQIKIINYQMLFIINVYTEFVWITTYVTWLTLLDDWYFFFLNINETLIITINTLQQPLNNCDGSFFNLRTHTKLLYNSTRRWSCYIAQTRFRTQRLITKILYLQRYYFQHWALRGVCSIVTVRDAVCSIFNYECFIFWHLFITIVRVTINHVCALYNYYLTSADFIKIFPFFFLLNIFQHWIYKLYQILTPDLYLINKRFNTFYHFVYNVDAYDNTILDQIGDPARNVTFEKANNLINFWKTENSVISRFVEITQWLQRYYNSILFTTLIFSNFWFVYNMRIRNPMITSGYFLNRNTSLFYISISVHVYKLITCLRYILLHKFVINASPLLLKYFWNVYHILIYLYDAAIYTHVTPSWFIIKHAECLRYVNVLYI